MNQTLLGTRLWHLRFDNIQLMLRVGVNRNVLGFAKENFFGAVVAVACHDGVMGGLIGGQVRWKKSLEPYVGSMDTYVGKVR